MEPANDLFRLVIGICALVVGLAWVVFPFAVIAKFNKVLTAIEELKATLIWQKTADDPVPKVEDSRD